MRYDRDGQSASGKTERKVTDRFLETDRAALREHAQNSAHVIKPQGQHHNDSSDDK